MKPGRELDALVAEKVMGAGWCQLMKEGGAISETGPRKCSCGSVGFPYEHHPPYSTDIAAAWEVVEKLLAIGIYMEMNCMPERVRCEFWSGRADDQRVGFASADTVPNAICVAALDAMG